jgi:PBSX family phage portal protein
MGAREKAASVAMNATDDLTERVRATIIGGGDRFELVGKSQVRKDSASLSSSASNDPANIITSAASGFAMVDGYLTPPFDPQTLYELLEHSNSLRQNIDSYATNIDGFGHHFEPTINLDADDARDKVRDAMFLDRLLRSGEGDPEAKDNEPTEAEVDSEIERLKRDMRIERARAESFFEYACPDISFVTLRHRTRADMETTGNGYWEVVRNAAGKPQQFVGMAAHTVRLVEQDVDRIPVQQVVQRGPITFMPQTVYRTFRRFIQIVAGQKPVWFKEFGDPRVISARTGLAYDDLKGLQKKEPKAVAANEVIHFRIHSATSAYGVPRWIGNLISVLGSRHAEEVNFTYFENKSIPPLVITVSGGRLQADSVKTIRSFIEGEIKGKRNFHKILILEADSPPIQAMMGLENSGRCRIEIKPLTDAHMKDALFQNYDERNIDKVGMSFRLPRMLRGDIRDFNRASAQAALEFAETQVFGPERLSTDFTLNRMILPALGIKYWKLVSDGPRITDPLEMAEALTKLSSVGILVPKDGRVIAADRVFHTELPRIDADWTEQPITMTIAGIPLDVTDDNDIPTAGEASGIGEPLGAVATAKRRLKMNAARLMKLRDQLEAVEIEESVAAKRCELREREARLAAKPPVTVVDDNDDEPEVIKIPADVFATMVQPT